MTKIPLEQIGYDPEYYPRVNGKEDWLTVHRYKEAVKSQPWKSDPNRPGAFPPVVVVKTTGYDTPYLLLDGLHRVRAWSAAGLDRIAATIESLPKSKWLERSVELNIDSKRPLDSGDKRWVAKKLSAEGWKPGDIANLLCMEGESFKKLMATNVQKISQASSKSIAFGRSNRMIGKESFGFLKAPFAAVSGTANGTKALKSQASTSAREAIQIIESFVALLESKAIDFTDERVSELLARAETLLHECGATA